ncbi:RNA polymerase sigma factor [Sorangium sp. So ce131]|uniref:RNA polymerase sigma factor n=1 Tax=Sorangium sp. So ce131 TaxID=3133282 RepID=UPI003F628FDB
MTRAIAGDDTARRGLVDQLTPVLRARVTRRLAARGAGSRSAHAEDLIQDVLMALFDEEARVLRAWDPGRGLSLANFVGLVTERHVLSAQRTRSRSLWAEEPTSDDEIVTMSGAVDETESVIAARELVARMFRRLAGELSPLGMQLLQLMFIEEVPIDRIAAELGMTRTSLYVWRHRLVKAARRCAEELGEEPELLA